MLTAGQQAPDFRLPDSDLISVSLSQYQGKKNVILLFYPKDLTTGCTLELVDFTEMMEELKACATVAIGVNRDNCESHARFRDQHGLEVRLLSDVEGEVCNDYGVWCRKEVGGEIKEGIMRSTFIIDKQGVIRHALYDVKPKGHAVTVLELVRSMVDPVRAA